jgi:hypothetical protein
MVEGIEATSREGDGEIVKLLRSRSKLPLQLEQTRQEDSYRYVKKRGLKSTGDLGALVRQGAKKQQVSTVLFLCLTSRVYISISTSTPSNPSHVSCRLWHNLNTSQD